MANTSGQGKDARVPDEIRGWNWGAFILNWIWGIGNQTYIAFLMFVPFVNLGMAFVLGAKGNEWAWRNKRWDSVEHFKRVQRKWGFWSAGAIAASFVFVFVVVSGVMLLMKQSGAYQLALSHVETHSEAREILGFPLQTGWFVTGKTSTNGPSGKANISFSVSGPKGSGTVYVDAKKVMGKWNLKNIVLLVDADKRRISLISRGG